MSAESSFAHAVVQALYQIDSVRSSVVPHVPPHSADECAQCALVAGFAHVTAARTSAGVGVALNKLLNDVSSLAPASDLAQVLRLCCADSVRVATRAVRDCGAVVRGSQREDAMLFAYAASLRRVQRLHAGPSRPAPAGQYESTSSALWAGGVAPVGGQVLLSHALARVCAAADEAWPICDNAACLRRRACGVRRQWAALPDVFAIGLLWSQAAPLFEQPHVEDITMALWLIDHELRVDDIFPCDPAMPPPSLYVLSVMLCNYGSRFVAFYKSSASGNTWIVYADGQAATCGDWSSVFERCRRELLQPFVVLYEKPPLVPCDVCQAPLAPRMGVRLTVRGANERICSSCMTTIARSLGVDALARATSVVVGGAELTRQRRRQLEPCSQCGDAVRTAFVDDAAAAKSWLCTRCVLARVIPAGALRSVPRFTVTGAPVAAATSMRGDDAPAPTGEYLHLPSRPAGVESPRTSGGAESLSMRAAAADDGEQQRVRRPRRGTAGDVPLTANVYGDLPRPAAGRTPYWLRRRVDMVGVQYVGACNECGADLMFQPNEQMPVSVTCAACSHVTVFPPISAIEPAPPVTARPLPQAPVTTTAAGEDDSDSRAVSKKHNLTCAYCNALLVSPADDPLAANGACAVCEWRRELAAVLEDDPPPNYHVAFQHQQPQHHHQQQQQLQQRRNPRGGAYHELPRSAYAALSTKQPQQLQPQQLQQQQNIYHPLDRVVHDRVGGDFRLFEDALLKVFDDAFSV